MNVLILYYSFTNQADEAARIVSEEMARGGASVDLCRLDFADLSLRPARPLSGAMLIRLGNMAQAGNLEPIVIEPPINPATEYDVVLMFSNTWKWHPAVPIQSFFADPAAQILANRPVALAIVCRGFWKNNLKVVRKMVLNSGGQIIAEDHFEHKGNWLLSTIQNVLYMTGTGPSRRRLGIIGLPDFGLSAASRTRLIAFAQRLTKLMSSSSPSPSPSPSRCIQAHSSELK